jgi:hypothetical protein
VITLCGLIGGIYTIFNIFSKINNLYNDLLYRDQLFEQKLDNQRDRLLKAEDDLNNTNFEHREARARIWDRLEALESRYYRADWQFLVDKGLLNQQQLERLREELFS